jgi:hypothetical protein
VRLKDRDGVFGTVTSDEFRGRDVKDRLNMIREVLDGKLDREERYKITLIVPMTPEESEDNDDE